MRCARPGKLAIAATIARASLHEAASSPRRRAPRSANCARRADARRCDKIHHLRRALAPRVVERAVDHEDAAAQNLADRNRHRFRRRHSTSKPRVDRGGMRIVDADHDMAALRGLFQQARLDRDIVLHRSVTVDMVGRDVGQNRHVGHETRREIDLIGRNLQHIDRAGRWRLRKSSTGLPILPPISAAKPQDARIWPISAVVVDLPLVPVTAMTGARPGLRAIGPDLAREQFDVADDLDAGGARARHHVMRRGMRQRHAGAEHQRLQFRPTASSCESAQRVTPSPSRFVARGFVVVPRENARAARLQRTHAAQARPRQPEDADVACSRRSVPAIIATSASTWKGRQAPARRR